MTKLHKDLISTIDLVYNKASLNFSEPVIDRESSEYGACTFKLNDLAIMFRVAKITPKKVGQFVTLWKRIDNSPIMPYDISDPVDFFVVSARHDERFGQFVFPKHVLRAKNIISQNSIGGKRAMRIYPPWDKAINIQAKNTQKWQLKYFFEIDQTEPIDVFELHRLYSLEQ